MGTCALRGVPTRDTQRERGTRHVPAVPLPGTSPRSGLRGHGRGSRVFAAGCGRAARAVLRHPCLPVTCVYPVPGGSEDIAQQHQAPGVPRAAVTAARPPTGRWQRTAQGVTPQRHLHLPGDAAVTPRGRQSHPKNKAQSLPRSGPAGHSGGLGCRARPLRKRGIPPAPPAPAAARGGPAPTGNALCRRGAANSGAFVRPGEADTAAPRREQPRSLPGAGGCPGGWQGGGRWHRGGEGAAAGTWRHTWHRGHRDQGQAGTRAVMPRAGLRAAAAPGFKQRHQ